MNSKTSRECKAEFKALLEAFMEKAEKIDNDTPWSNLEPQWWCDMKAMMSVGRIARENLDPATAATEVLTYMGVGR